jgi:hypothetical protein
MRLLHTVVIGGAPLSRWCAYPVFEAITRLAAAGTNAGIAMRELAFVAVAAAFFLNLCSCSAPGETSAAMAEQSITASCRAWEERAKKSAHPDSEMTIQHDQLMAKAAKFSAEAQAQYHNVAVRQAAIENEAQAEIEADAIYDWRYKLKVASDCWENLKLVEEMHREQRQRLSRLAGELAAEQSTSRTIPQRSVYTPPTHLTQPPSPPSPSPVPNLGQTYIPPAPKTWGDTPYAPAIPPAMRDQPVTNVNPMIPPAAR